MQVDSEEHHYQQIWMNTLEEVVWLKQIDGRNGN
jgi:hypothetical protein